MENLFAGWPFSSSDYAIMINLGLLMNSNRKWSLDTNLCKLKFCWRLSFLLRQTSSTQCWAASESKNCQKHQITKNNKLKLSGVKCTQNYFLNIKISDSIVLYSFQIPILNVASIVERKQIKSTKPPTTPNFECLAAKHVFPHVYTLRCNRRYP